MLRFKADDGSDFPEWEENTLGTFCVKIGSGKTPKGGRKIYCDNGVMFIRSQNVLNGILDLTDVVYITNDINESMLSTVLEEYDILLNITGASIGRCCLYLCKKKANVNQHVCIIRLDKNADIIPEFLLQYILSDCIQNQIKSFQSGGSREGLNFQQVSNFIVYRPSLPEQHKIAAVLSTIDEIISATEAEVSAWEERKKGVMQKLFSQEVRFKTDDGSDYPEWEEKKLGELTKRISRRNKDGISDIPLTISSAYGLIDQRKYFNKVVAAQDLTNYYLLKKGEFAYNRSSSVGYDFGAIKRLDEYECGAVSTLYICFSIKDDNVVYSDFLVEYFDSCKWNKYAGTVCAEGARNHGLLNISVNDFFDMPILLPSLPEQRKIADCLSSFDDVINQAKAELAAWQEFKKGLLQQMFV